MKKTIFFYLTFFLFLIGTLCSCEEVDETTKYDNWQERNEAYVDSVKIKTGEFYVATVEQARAMEVGKLYAIKVEEASTSNTPLYVYCKKITKNDAGRRPLYTETVKAYYYGTLITGDKFDGNFAGYSAVDRQELDPEGKKPTEFDSPNSFTVTRVLPGWKTALQYMRTGERWMVYIPWPCAYGSSDQGRIPGYSTLAFDIMLESVE